MTNRWEELRKQTWVEVGHGTRRICYRLGESGYCVKFYIPRERYDDLHVRKTARRDIEAHRFDRKRNSSALEVDFYWKHWKKLPSDISDKLLPFVECVFDEKFGYGILETYFTNPDGTAIRSFHHELGAENPWPVREAVYRRSRDLLLKIIRASAFFYEPGNLHAHFLKNGEVEIRIVDFEPISKTFIPIEHWWPWYRRWKLCRKARRFLATVRSRYHLDIPNETKIG